MTLTIGINSECEKIELGSKKELLQQTEVGDQKPDEKMGNGRTPKHTWTCVREL